MRRRTNGPTELTKKILTAIGTSNKILVLGFDDEILDCLHEELNPSICWYLSTCRTLVRDETSTNLHRVPIVGLDNPDLSGCGGGYDCVLLGKFLDVVREPAQLLVELRRITTDESRLVCLSLGTSHTEVEDGQPAGGSKYDMTIPTDEASRQPLSQPALFKLLLDHGWLPNLVDPLFLLRKRTSLVHRLIGRATGKNYSFDALAQEERVDKLIVSAMKWPDRGRDQMASVSVIVPVNNEEQFAADLMCSPGLREIGAEIIPCRNARSAADAFDQGRAKATGDWLLFCHQDVYFPAGSGFALSNELLATPVEQLRRAIIGFVGVGSGSPVSPDPKKYSSGLVVDRTHLHDWPSTEHALSLDELAVVVRRDTLVTVDPALGWHLWATDLCLMAMRENKTVLPRIIRVPVFHNSRLSYSLPAAFFDSAEILASKHAKIKRIPTLCGTIGKSFARKRLRRNRILRYLKLQL